MGLDHNQEHYQICHSHMLLQCDGEDSNLRRRPFQSRALPAELPPHIFLHWRDRARTCGLPSNSRPLCHLSYTPLLIHEAPGDRTLNLPGKGRLLYQLS